MAERITIQLVRASRGENIIVEAGGDDIDAAVAAFDAAVADHNRPINGRVFVRAVLDLDDGDVSIQGAPTRGRDAAREIFDAVKTEYMSGPGWGGTG